jgi:pimeloyl-ACP methyl ester carboxylesterase
MAALLETVPHDVGLAQAIPDRLQECRSIRCPTLLLLGLRSPPFLRESIARLQSLIPGARTVELPGVSHNAPDMEAPEAVAAQLSSFFAG